MTRTLASRTGALLAAAVTVAVALGACAPSASAPTATATAPASASIPLSELEIPQDPHALTGPSTAILADSSITPVVENPQPTLPVTVTSHDLSGDVSVEVASVDRVIALDISGSIAATVAGLGMADRLVGRDVSTTIPGTDDLPIVTSSGHTINSEAILELRPDVVITDGSIGPVDVVEQLRDAGVTVVFVTNEPSFEGAAALATQVGDALGVSDAGALLAQTLTDAIDAKLAEIAEIVPAGEPLRMMFLYVRGNSGVYYIFGGESGADVLIDALGGIDAAAEAGIEGMRPATDEALIAAAPEVLLVMTKGLDSAGGIDGLLEAQPALALTPAGINQRIVDMADGDILSFGPRTPGVLDALARAIYAPAS